MNVRLDQLEDGAIATTTHKNFFRNTGETASDDAILFHFYQLVSTRVSKVIYGSFIHIASDPYNPGHQYPSQNAFTSGTGARRLRGSFSIILTKVSCLFPFLKNLSVLFKELLLVEYPIFEDEDVQKILLYYCAIDSAGFRPM